MPMGQPTTTDSVIDQPPERGTGMTDEDKAQLAELQAKQAEDKRADSEPTEDNFTHYVHLADGRVKMARGAAGSVYSEGAGTQDEPEQFTPVIGVYPRIMP
jgi:hypothetical protein